MLAPGCLACCGGITRRHHVRFAAAQADLSTTPTRLASQTLMRPNSARCTGGRMGSFLDGGDLCEGCSKCCEQVTGLTVTPDELDRVPRLREHVSSFDGTFYVIDVKGGRCPYLSDAGWCTTFETRPFDCSLYPVALSSIKQREDGSALVKWHKGALECPHRTRCCSKSSQPSSLRFSSGLAARLVSTAWNWSAHLTRNARGAFASDCSGWRAGCPSRERWCSDASSAADAR